MTYLSLKGIVSFQEQANKFVHSKKEKRSLLTKREKRKNMFSVPTRHFSFRELTITSRRCMYFNVEYMALMYDYLKS